jgi:hypothetical protein
MELAGVHGVTSNLSVLCAHDRDTVEFYFASLEGSKRTVMMPLGPNVRKEKRSEVFEAEYLF